MVVGEGKHCLAADRQTAGVGCRIGIDIKRCDARKAGGLRYLRNIAGVPASICGVIGAEEKPACLGGTHQPDDLRAACRLTFLSR